MKSQYDFECKPIVAWLNVNQKCNMRCKWCYAENTHYVPSENMTLDLAVKLVDIAINLGVQEFCLIGGEPLLWPHFFDIVQYIQSRGMTVSAITNAMKLGEAHFWEQYQKTPASSLGVSVKAVSPSVLAQTTGVNQHEKAMLGIQRAISFHHGGVSAVHNNLTGISEMLKIARQCKDFGATSFQLVLCTPSFNDDGTVSQQFTIPLKKIWADLKVLSQGIEDLYGDNVCYDTQLPLCLFPKKFVATRLAQRRLQTQCHIFSRSGLNFDTHGNVILCNTIAETIAKIGQDFDDDVSLRHFLNSKEVKANYRQVARYPSPECTKCRWADDCRGGCLMNWLVYDPINICHAIT